MKRNDETDEAKRAKRLKQKAIERWENEGGKLAADGSSALRSGRRGRREGSGR